MSRAAVSLRVFSIYLAGLGLLLVLAPNVLLGWFGIPATREVWIRVVGLLVLILGYYAFMAAGRDMTDFFRWSVHARLAVPLAFLLFVVADLAPPVLLLFGLVDGAAALWTAACLRRDAQAGRKPSTDR